MKPIQKSTLQIVWHPAFEASFILVINFSQFLNDSLIYIFYSESSATDKNKTKNDWRDDGQD